jgi:hypothetical protein
LIADTITTPFRTATPESAMNPTPAEMLNGIPRIQSAMIPPVTANGTPVKIKIACFKDPNVRNSSEKISARAMGTTIINRALACCRFSNWPPQVR